MPWDRKHLLGYVETIQLILGATDKKKYRHSPTQLSIKSVKRVFAKYT